MKIQLSVLKNQRIFLEMKGINTKVSMPVFISRYLQVSIQTKHLTLTSGPGVFFNHSFVTVQISSVPVLEFLCKYLCPFVLYAVSEHVFS